MTRRQALLLRIFAGWTIYVWATRVWNIYHDHTKGHGAAFKAVHYTLALISVVLAVAAWRVVTKVMRRRGERHDAADADADALTGRTR